MDEDQAAVQTNDTDAPLDQSPSQEPEQAPQDTTEAIEPQEVEETLPEEGEESEEPQSPPISNRAAKRAEQLEELKINKILKRIRGDSPRPPEENVTSPLDYEAELDAPEDVLKKLQDDRMQYGEAKYNDALAQVRVSEFKTGLKIEAPKVEEKYSFLDKNSEEFSPALADAINQDYLTKVGYKKDARGREIVERADISYADHVESIMELAERIAATTTIKARENITKQAAQTAIRPTGAAAPKLDFRDPAVIAKLTPEEYAKHRKEIYRQAGLSL